MTRIDRRCLAQLCGAILLIAMPSVHARASDCRLSPATTTEVRRAADSIASQPAAADEPAARQAVSRGLAAAWPNLVTRVAIEAHTDAQLDAEFLSVASSAGEVARTDKQIGAPSGASGTTTLTENAALPLLLGFAAEYGAITQESNGTTATFSTSPYAIAVLGQKDTDELYRRHWLARSFGLSASFALDSTAGLNGLEADDLSSLRMKYTWGDRSTRSADFQEHWRTGIQGDLREVVTEQDRLLSTILADRDLRKIADDEIDSRIEGNALSRLAATVLEVQGVPATEQPQKIQASLEEQLCRVIYRPVQENPPAVLTSASFGPVLKAIDTRKSDIDAKTRELVESFQENAELVSVTYQWNNITNGSDYSEFVLIADGFFGDLGGLGCRLVANASVAINHDPDPTLQQDRVRDYNLSVNIEKQVHNALFANVAGSSEFSRVAFSLGGRYERLEDIDANVGTVQAKMVLPIAAGFGIPFSLSWSSRSETSTANEFKVGVGLDFDAEALAALTRLSGRAAQ